MHSKKQKDRLSQKLWSTALLIVVVIGIAISFLLYSGPDFVYDDTFYLSLAHSLLEGNIGFAYNRFGFAPLKLVPTAISFGLLGYGNFQAILPSVIEYILLILTTFAVGKKLYGNAFACLSAFFVATAPFVIGYVTRPLADILLGLAVAVSIYFFVADWGSRHDAAWATLLGIMTAGLAYIKFEGFSILLATFVSMIIVAYFTRKAPKNRAIQNLKKKIRPRSFLLFLLGALAVVLLDLLFVYYAIGYAFWQFEFYSVTGNSTPIINEIAKLFIPILTSNPKYTNTEIYPPGLIFIFFVLGSVIGVARIKSEPYVAYISLIGIIFVIYMLFGPSSLHFLSGAYVSVPFVTRFLNTIALPMAILATYFLFSIYRFAKHHMSRNQSIAIVLALLIANICCYIPDYYMFWYFSNGYVKPLASTFVSVMNYTYHNAGSDHVNIFSTGYYPFGFELMSYNAFRYLSGFGRHGSVYMIMENATLGEIKTYYLPEETALECNASLLDKPSYLISMVSIDNATQSKDVQNVVNAWLGKNCTAYYLTNINTNTGFTFSIYKLEPT